MRLAGNRRLVVSVGLGVALTAGLVLAPAGLLAPPQAAAQTNQTTVTFGYSGGAQIWTVPAGVSSARFDVSGAQGGSGCTVQALGGLGGEVLATLAVAPGQVV
jgi:hypothetical protein